MLDKRMFDLKRGRYSNVWLMIAMNEDLLSSESLCEWFDDNRCCEAEEESEGDGDGKSRKSFSRDSQKEKRKTQTLK